MQEPYLGDVRMFGGNFAPRTWAFSNGQLLSIAQNTALYSLLGTTYGGDGVVTFGLPDLRGRAPVGQGQGNGLSNRVMGEMSGQEQVTLLLSNLPGHNHGFFATQANANTSTIGPTVLLGTAVASSGTPHLYIAMQGNTAAPLSSAAVGMTGNTQPHPNMMPTLTLNFTIALQGVYPSRN
ncbi:MAG TPA: tail fiber protein [Pseudolabrys sp.]|jgi:microcystin-dependent protein|nr:tail fiber protein [Pseudolabrys sp.]